LSSNRHQIPRVITVDKNPAYSPAINELKNDKILPKNVGIRQIKYLNNIIEKIMGLKSESLIQCQDFSLLNMLIKL
jgi:transposase-like protein